MQNHSVPRRIAGAILVCVCLLAAVPAVSQTEEEGAAPVFDAEAGRVQGKADARGNGLWFIPGLLLPGVGMVLPWVFSPTVPAENLIGKSDEYVAAYRTAYIHRKKLGNFLWSLAGTGTTVAVIGGVGIYVAVAAAVGATTACGETISQNCSDALSGACNDACADVFTPTCSVPTIGCSSLGFLPLMALSALPP